MANWLQRCMSNAKRIFPMLLLIVALAPPATTRAGVSSDDAPVDYLQSGESTTLGCISVSVEHEGLFFAVNPDYANAYGFSKDSYATFTFTPGIRTFKFLTWAHGDVGDPITQYEQFTVVAYDGDGDEVETLVVEDRDQVFGDYEAYEMQFDERVRTIIVSYIAVYPPGEASSALIPFLRAGEGCSDLNLDGYLEKRRGFVSVDDTQSPLPNTL